MSRYLLFALVPMAFGFVVQWRLKSTVRKYMRVQSASDTTGEEAAETILRAGGLADKVEVKYARGGPLSDHFNPGDKTVNLSKAVHDKTSIASNAIAAHEVGHVYQDFFGGGLYKVRSFMWPMVSIATQSWILLVAGGAIFNAGGWVTAGFVLYAVTVLFQLVTLPVEFNASFGKDHALDQLLANGLLTEDEIPGARKVLRAAAMTYVAGALAAVSQFVFFLLEYGDAKEVKEARRERRQAMLAPRQPKPSAGEPRSSAPAATVGRQMTRAATKAMTKQMTGSTTKAAKRQAGRRARTGATESRTRQLLGRR